MSLLATEAREVEEQYILRVRDPTLADQLRCAGGGMAVGAMEPWMAAAACQACVACAVQRLLAPLLRLSSSHSRPASILCRAALRAEGAGAAAGRAQLAFADSDRSGTFTFGGRSYPVTVLNLPSVVESYKTLDDVNLVKTTDIGQVGAEPGGAGRPAVLLGGWVWAAGGQMGAA